MPGTHLAPNVLKIKKIHTRKELYVQLCKYLQSLVHSPSFPLCSNCLENGCSDQDSLHHTNQCSCSSRSIFPKIKKVKALPLVRKFWTKSKNIRYMTKIFSLLIMCSLVPLLWHHSHESWDISKGGISYIPWCFATNFCLLSAVERAFEGFEGDFERSEFQDAAHPR